MASHSRYKSSSPIGYLDKNSPKPLDVILEQNTQYDVKTRWLLAENQNLYSENKALTDKLHLFACQNNEMADQNARLKKGNQTISKVKEYTSNNYNKQLELKQQQINTLTRDLGTLKTSYENEIKKLLHQNENLQKKYLIQQQQCKQDVLLMKSKYTINAAEDIDLFKKNYKNDFDKLIGQLQTTKELLIEKEKEYDYLSKVSRSSAVDFNQNLEQLITENNIMRSKLAELELNKYHEIKQIEGKKQLQKSRTQGIMLFCKENNIFLEKEIKQLTEQLINKNINIEIFTKNLIKQKKKIQDIIKKYQDIIEKNNIQYKEIYQEKNYQIKKIEKYHQENLAQQKQREMKLMEDIASKQNQLENCNRDLVWVQGQVLAKDKDIIELKANIERLNDEHSRQISKIMSESKVKRRSMKNLSSLSSLKDMEDPQGSLIRSGHLQRQNSLNEEGQLPMVRQQLASSRQQQEIDIKQLVQHYEGVIDQLKKNKILELQIANGKIEGLKDKLDVKQQEILDVLNRFSPLLEFKLNPQLLDEERKSKIQQHYRADLGLLEVMLNKYGIVALKSSR